MHLQFIIINLSLAYNIGMPLLESHTWGFIEEMHMFLNFVNLGHDYKAN